MRCVKTLVFALAAVAIAGAYEPIHVGFLWHMHQPIYYPYETPVQTDAAGRFSYSVVDIHNQRFGPYTTWPKDAIDAGLSLPHLGAQVSFTGSLIENLNALEAAGVNGGMWNNWDWGYDTARGYLTSLGNRRLDLVAFGYHHPLMPLLDETDLRMQIALHRYVYGQTWAGGGYSAGLFPPETAFAERMIPALVAEVLLPDFNDGYLKPRMTGPELVLHVDLRPEGVFIYSERIQGPGGLPVGTQGKGIVLLSGGIDSPVAAWLAMKRGLVLEALHFDSYPYTSRQSLDKVKKIVRILSEWAGEMKLHVVNFTETQETIRDNCNERYHTVLFRRMMARVGDGLAERIGAKALVSGENLGQVASQTIENIHCVESVCSRPVLKPLITYDKQEIIDLAKRIGTFETSILPYPDCCTVFTPKKPIIRGDEAAAQREEKKLPLEELLAGAMETIETYTP